MSRPFRNIATLLSQTVVIAIVSGCSNVSSPDSESTVEPSTPIPSVESSSTEHSRLLPEGSAQCEVDGYLLGVHPDGVFLFRDETPLFSVLGNSRSIWDSWRPIVSVDDQTNDGVLDRLVYDVHSEDSSRSTTVMDRDFDGQADIRVVSDYTTREFTHWLWVENGWYEKLQDSRVLVDGKPHPYVEEKGNYTFAKSP